MRFLLSRLVAVAEAVDRAQHRADYRVAGSAVGVLVAGALLALPVPEGLAPAAWRTLAVAALMAVWWLGQVMPLAVTALVPLVAFPALDVASVTDTALPYASPLVFLMLGGFFLGHAMEEVGLHERLTARMLRPDWVRATPRRVLLALMASAAVLSGLVSNTATTVMMLPLAVYLAEQCGLAGRSRSGFALGLAYAASIGGVSTIIGTFPNAVFVSEAAKLGHDVSFASWALIGVPFVLVALPVAWLVVGGMLVPGSWRDGPVDAPRAGPWRHGEAAVLAVVLAAMALWLSRKPIDLGPLTVPGWADAVPFGSQVHDAWVAILAAIALFAIPGRRVPGGVRAPLLDWRRAHARIPWGVLFLLGGGFALAERIEASGLTAWLAGFTAPLAELPLPIAILALCLAVTFLTELTSNTATTQILLPLLAGGAVAAGVEPLQWMVPATISASCAFMMPVATPPNAIAAEGGAVSTADMASAGLVLNLALAVVATAVGLTIVPWATG